jgi:hypothetical protein
MHHGDMDEEEVTQVDRRGRSEDDGRNWLFEAPSQAVVTCAGCGDEVDLANVSLSGALCADCDYCYGEPGY